MQSNRSISLIRPLNYLKPIYVWVIFIQNKVIVAVNYGPAFDAGYNGGLVCQFGFGFDTPVEN